MDLHNYYNYVRLEGLEGRMQHEHHLFSLFCGDGNQIAQQIWQKFWKMSIHMCTSHHLCTDWLKKMMLVIELHELPFVLAFHLDRKWVKSCWEILLQNHNQPQDDARGSAGESLKSVGFIEYLYQVCASSSSRCWDILLDVWKQRPSGYAKQTGRGLRK